MMEKVEVTSLETLTFINRTILPGILRLVLWLFGGSWGSVVVPLGKNLDPTTKISPTDEIFELARRTKVKAVARCYCRWRNQDYKYPQDTCLILGTGFDTEELKRMNKLVPGTTPQAISDEQLRKVLEDADRFGLVHQFIYFPSPRYFYVICNCAPTSCTTLRNLIRWGTPDVVHSNFTQTTDLGRCTGCGTCVKRCPFRAREMINNTLKIISQKCFGCGLCVSTCPARAIKLIKRNT